MNSRHKVLFYGNSLVLAGIQAGLRSYPGFEVTALDKPATDTELLAFEPSVVVFDLGAFESEYLLAQTQALPGLLLIGIDAESHEVLLTGQAAGLIPLDQIAQIVRSWDQPGEGKPDLPPTKAA